jgi:hypothetical protein
LPVLPLLALLLLALLLLERRSRVPAQVLGYCFLPTAGDARR